MKTKIISSFWIITGLLLGTWCAKEMYDSYHYFQFISGSFKSSFIGLVYAVLITIGGAGVMKSKNWGRRLLNISISIAIFYSIIFVVFHGYLDRPVIYSFWVALIFFASILSLIYINSNEITTKLMGKNI